jgi:HD-GYP domain-containing protein (c-di-GMP phosphodiesterase class II)
MRQHPARGVALVNALSIPHQAYQGILFHHERFGGGGYPADLQGEAIPLVARVICACDVYDALTSQRAYAPAESPFKAIQIMCTAMKSHFDPKILKGIISVLSGAKIIKSQ